MEKISANPDSKNFYIEICTIAQRIHEETSCKEEDCQTKQFIGLLEELIGQNYFQLKTLREHLNEIENLL